MKRICLIAKSTYPLDTRIIQQARVIEEAGYALDIVCLRLAGQPRRELHGATQVFRIQFFDFSKSGFAGYLLASTRFALRSLLFLLGHALRKRYRVIVVHTLPEFLVLITLLNKLTGSRVVLDARDITVELLGSRWRTRAAALLRPAALAVEQLCCALADRVFAASPGFKRRLEGRGVPAAKTRLLMNTADPHIFRFQEDRKYRLIKSGATLVYHGTVSPRFGVLVAVEALGLVNAAIPGSRLRMCGVYDADYRAEIEARRDSLGLRGQVAMEGAKDLLTIRQWIAEADFGIVPYLDDEFMNLALSTKTFEYVASGLPVVASRLRSSEELFPDSCLRYARPGNAGEFAEAIIALCRDPRERERRAREAAQVYQRYSGEVNAALYRSTIDELAGAGKP